MKKPICRIDGWTPARRDAFLAAIECRADVSTAAAAAGMSRESVYRLRRRDGAFASQWAARIAAVDARDWAEAEVLLAAVEETNPGQSLISAHAHLTPGKFDRWLMRTLSGGHARAATRPGTSRNMV